MESSAALQFKVSLRSMKIAPAVGPKGFARAVEFRVTSLDTRRTRAVDGGLVGEETLRRCEVLRHSGPEVVTVTGEWMNQHVDSWPIGVVNLALERAATR